jgi:hypothetical protein
MKRWQLIVCFVIVDYGLLTPARVYSQSKTDSVAKTKPHQHHLYPNPARAILMSAVLPGLGQGYEKKYWKIPIIYAALGTMAYLIAWNQNQYNMYLSALNQYNATGTDPYINVYSTDELNSLVTYYHRDRDLSIIGAFAVYVVNLLDADVTAQLYGFNVTEDISLNIIPLNTNSFNRIPALALAIKI